MSEDSIQCGGGPVPSFGRVTERFRIVNEQGLHLRAAAKLALVVSSFSSQVLFAREGRTARAKSVMEMLILGASKGTSVEVIASGADARECVAAIGDLIARGFKDPR